MALGAGTPPAHVVRRVLADMLLAVCLGAVSGIAGGLAVGGLVEPLLFEVKASGSGVILTPLLVLAAAACVAALPPAMRVVRLDPAQILRNE